MAGLRCAHSGEDPPNPPSSSAPELVMNHRNRRSTVSDPPSRWKKRRMLQRRIGEEVGLAAVGILHPNPDSLHPLRFLEPRSQTKREPTPTAGAADVVTSWSAGIGHSHRDSISGQKLKLKFEDVGGTLQGHDLFSRILQRLGPVLLCCLCDQQLVHFVRPRLWLWALQPHSAPRRHSETRVADEELG